VSVKGASFLADGTISSLWHDRGIHFFNGSLSTYSCEASQPAVDTILRTGTDRTLVGGKEGAFLTLSDGCKWKQTGGVYSFDEVVGLYRDGSNNQRVLIIYGDKASVALSTDGGHTTDNTPILSVSNVDFNWAVSRGPALLITGRSRLDQSRLYWWSTDSGDSFQSGALGLGPDLRPWTLDGNHAWLSEGKEMKRLELASETLSDGKELPGDVLSVALDASEQLWLALGEAGMWRLDGNSLDELSLEREGSATWVAWQADMLWMGTVIYSWDEPAVLRLPKGAQDWENAIYLSPDLLLPDACVTLNSKLCAESVEDWQLAFGANSDVTEDPDPQPTQVSDGCSISASKKPPFLLLYIALWFMLRRYVRPIRSF